MPEYILTHDFFETVKKLNASTKFFTLFLLVTLANCGVDETADTESERTSEHMNGVLERQLARFDEGLAFHMRHWNGDVKQTAVFYLKKSENPSSNNWYLESLNGVRSQGANTYISVSVLEKVLLHMKRDGIIEKTNNSGSSERLFKLSDLNLASRWISETEDSNLLEMRLPLFTFDKYVPGSLVRHHGQFTPKCEVPTHSFKMRVHQDAEQKSFFGEVSEVTFRTCMRSYDHRISTQNKTIVN